MNDIFNLYTHFTIIYIDNILVCSNSVDQHFKHLHTFLHVIKKNGLVVSAPKIKLFQTKIRFLVHDIYQDTIRLIARAIEFVDKFSDEIKDKTQLQCFLGCLNYVSNFFPNLRKLCEPL